MPYRDQATVQSWVDEFCRAQSLPTEVTVLEKDFVAGPDSGIVIVSLRTASTVTYLQVVTADDGPRWIVTFEPRHEGFDLDSAGIAALAQDLTTLSQLCDFLQEKTDAVILAR